MRVERYRIAFSFAGEKRYYVAQVAAILAKRFGKDAILYDKYHGPEFSRSDLARYLPNLYATKADLVVMVFCPDYDKKKWCGLEWDAVFGLLIAERKVEQVMLTRFEHAEGKGLSGLAGYTDLDVLTPEQAADMILERLALNEGLPREYYKTASSDLLGEDRRPPSAIQDPRAPGALSRDTIKEEKRTGPEMTWEQLCAICDKITQGQMEPDQKPGLYPIVA